MKISAVNYTNIFTNKTRINSFSQAKKSENTNNSVATNPIKTEQLPMPDYRIYTIPSRDERIYTSKNADLIEVPSNFKLGKIDNVPCPACGKVMLPLAKYDEIANELDNAKNEEYLNILQKHSKYMRPVEYSVLKDIQKISDTTGEKDIRKLIESLRDYKLPILQKIQMKKIKQMSKIAGTLPEDEKQMLIAQIKELSKMIKAKNAEAPFRRKLLIEKIQNVPISNKDKYNKLQNIAKSFPRSFDMNSSWIVKYSGNDKQGQPYDSKEIALRMFSSSIPNTDHIIPRDIEEHRDEIPNYMSMHRSCNSQKANKPFMQWFNEDRKTREASLKAYFAKARSLIDSGEIADKRYQNYVSMATDVIREASNEKVDLIKDK